MLLVLISVRNWLHTENYTTCPKIKSALGKHLELALHGFRVGIFNPKKADFILGHPVEGG